MGKGATNTIDRVAASLGLLKGVTPSFELSFDVAKGGVLFAIPALLSCGLLKNVANHFNMPAGYYTLENIFILLGLMALARIKSIETLRFISPGEWGKLIGLDRIPEVKTLRAKIKMLAEQHHAEKWSADLCAQWMASYDENSFIFYVDGHVRVYHGNQTKLPKHYVAREKLCLRATVDYWVNANDGQPFLLVNKAIDPGIIKTIEQDVLPAIDKSLPETISKKELRPYQHRFALVFDREGYSPDFLQRMKNKKIACITYHKFPKEEWCDDEFGQNDIQLASGEKTAMLLAERGTKLSNGLWVREIRKLSKKGHQTSIISTDYYSELKQIAGRMFDRWSQENFFKYMRKHYNIDALVSNDLEPIPDTTKIVNPKHRTLTSQIKSKTAQISKKLTAFGEMLLIGEIATKQVDKYQKKKADLKDDIEQMQEDIHTLKKSLKEIPKHIYVSQLFDDEKFNQLKTNSKHFIDTIKMIAYRAETALSNILREHLSRKDDARNLVVAIFNTDADIIPNYKNKTLTIQLHNLTNKYSDSAIEKLIDEINKTKTIFPGTNLRIFYKMVSMQNHRGKDV
jgi:hypothetical protein